MMYWQIKGNVRPRDEIFVLICSLFLTSYYSSCVMSVHFLVPTCHSG